jgi:hypothetical protein
MSTLVVGDIHGCAEEFAALVQAVAPTRLVCVGDLFTKGPDPVGVWSLVREFQAESVLGNHDDRLLQFVTGHRPDDAGARRCAGALDAAAPGWREWTASLPLFLHVEPFVVVHASLHTSGEIAKTTREMALYWRRWPDDRADAPHWHEVYGGSTRVIFGHDARRGLVRVERSGKPWIVGLDSGCVYGGSLSGYLVEEDRVVQQRARRVYKAVG